MNPKHVLIILLFGLCISNAYSASDFFSKLDSVSADLTHGEAIFTLRNPTALSMALNPSKLTARYSYSPGATEVMKTETYILKTSVKYQTIRYQDGEICETNKGNGTITCSPIMKEASIPYNSSDWIKFDFSEAIPSGQEIKIKMVGIWAPKLGNNSRDWIPSLDAGTAGRFEASDWAWLLVAWTKRANLTFNSTASSDIARYQIPINITYDADMKADFTDLRFTYYNATTGTETEIAYWTEGYSASSWAWVWLNMTYLSTAHDETIYMYYGNAAAANVSDGNSTFYFFDDFGDDSIDANKWRVDAGFPVESGGLMTIANASAGEAIAGTTSNQFGTNYALRGRSRVSSTNTNVGAFGWSNGTSADLDVDPWKAYFYTYTNLNRYRNNANGSTNAQTTDASSDTNYHIYEIVRNQTAGTLNYLRYDAAVGQVIWRATHTTFIPIVNFAPKMSKRTDPNSVETDWVFVRKYINPEPRYVSIGSEESVPTISVYNYTAPMNTSYVNLPTYDYLLSLSNLGSAYCSYYLDGAETNLSYQIAGNILGTLHNLAYGSHEMYMTCANGSFSATSNTTAFMYVPTLTIVNNSPSNASYPYRPGYSFTLALNGFGSAYCGYTLDGIFTNLSYVAPGAFAGSLPSLTIGSHTINATCANESISNISNTISFMYSPSMAVVNQSPMNMTYGDIPTYNFSLEMSDRESAFCGYDLDGVFTNLSYVSNNSFSSGSLAVSAGGHLINFTCANDTLTNTTGTISFEFRPTIFLFADRPPNASINTNYLNYSFHMNQSVIPSAYCGYDLDGVFTNLSIQYNGTYIEGSLPVLSLGSHLINFTCANGTESDYVEVYFMAIVSTSLDINLQTPDGYVFATHYPTLYFNATNDLYSLMNCTLYIEGINMTYNETTQNATETVLLPSFELPNGFYEWLINCSNLDISNISSTRTAVVNVPPITDTEDDAAGLALPFVFLILGCASAIMGFMYDRAIIKLFSGTLFMGLGILLMPYSVIALGVCIAIGFYLWARVFMN